MSTNVAWYFFKNIFVLETLGALPDPVSNYPIFYTIFHKSSKRKFTKHNLEKVSCPISSPRQRLSIAKDSRKKYPKVKEESCHNFLSTRSCFCSSVSDGRYLMLWMTLRLLCMTAQIIQTMAFTQIMDIWRPGRSLEDHLNLFWPCDLDLWPMTLTYKLDLDILPLDLRAKIQVSMSIRLAGTVRQTHTHTDGRCQNYYTDHIRDVGRNNTYGNNFPPIFMVRYWKFVPKSKVWVSGWLSIKVLLL